MFSTRFVEQGRGVFFVGSGTVTWSEVHAAKSALIGRQDLLPRITFVIVDLKDATELNMTPGEIRQLAHLDACFAHLIPDAVVAIVAPSDAVFGLARMWEVFVETSGWRTSVFRSSEEACAWVVHHGGVPAEP